MAIFPDVKKKRLIFLITHLSLIFVDKGIVFQENIEMGLKKIFIIFERFYRMTKIKHNSSNF